MLYQSIQRLTEADTHLTEKVNAIEVLVAGDYVKRNEFDNKVDAVFRKLDTIEDKLDRKLDNFRKP